MSTPRLDQLAVIRQAFVRPDRLDRAAIEAARDRRLRRLVTHAYERVPFYRRIYDAHGVTPGDVRGLADLTRLPIVTKPDLLGQAPRDVVARGIDPDRLVTLRTGGSTDLTIDIRHTWWESRVQASLRKPALRAFGLRLDDRIARLKLVRTETRSDDERLSRMLQRLGLYRQANLHCLLPPGTLLETLAEYDPDVLIGTMSILARLAHVGRDHPAAARVRPRIIVQTGEVVTADHRRLITEVFGCPLRDLYSSLEANVMAWECPRTGAYHTCDDGTIVEVLDGNRPVAPGARGEVVATNLHAFAMPFIRYRHDDLVVRGDDRCPCGAPFGTIREIRGRMLDWLRLPGGRVVHVWDLSTLYWDADWAIQRRVVQEREERIVLQVVPARPPTPAEMAAILDPVRERLGPDVDFRIELVESLDFEPSGKFRLARSHVASDYDGVSCDP